MHKYMIAFYWKWIRHSEDEENAREVLVADCHGSHRRLLQLVLSRYPHIDTVAIDNSVLSLALVILLLALFHLRVPIPQN